MAQLGQSSGDRDRRGTVTAWSGTFIAFWKRPPAVATSVEPGARGKDVVWLRQRLGQIEGTIVTPASAPDTYDRELQSHVVEFQRRRALASDAIVGDETLAHLSLAADPHPSLVKKP